MTLNLLYLVLILNVFCSLIYSSGINKSIDLDDLLNIFKPDKDMDCFHGYGINVSQYLNTLGKDVLLNTTQLCLFLKGNLQKIKTEGRNSNLINLSALAYLPQLQELWILPDSSATDVMKDFKSAVYFTNTNIQERHLTELKQLHFEIPLSFNDIDGISWRPHFRNLLRECNQLQVLSMAGTYMLLDFKDINSVFNGTNLSSLRALSLSAILKFEHSYFYLNMSEIFELYQTGNLEYLDISKKYIYTIYGSVLAILPKLKIIDLSYNMLSSIDDVTVWIELFAMHPSMEIVYADGQNRNPMNNILKKNYHFAKHERHIRDLSKKSYEIIQK